MTEAKREVHAPLMHPVAWMPDGKPSGYFQRTCQTLLQHPLVPEQGGIAVRLLADWVRYPGNVPAAVSLELAESIAQFLWNEMRRPRAPVADTDRLRFGESQAVRLEALAIRLEAILTRAVGAAARLKARQTRHASVLLRYEAAGLRNSCRPS